MGADGSRSWARPVTSFEKEWGIDAFRSPAVRTGYDAFDPFEQVSNRVYALGELTESATQYLAVAHSVAFFDPGFTYGTFLTVIEAATGETVWFRFVPGAVTQLLIENRTLVIGEETGTPRSQIGGEAGAKSNLTALTFSPTADGNLAAQETWKHSTGAEWARWLALEPARPGTVVASWTDAQPGSGSEERGHVLLLDAAEGTALWDTITPTYPRLLRHDPGRDQIVVVGQDDPSAQRSYTVSALREADGTPAGATVTRPEAVPFALEVGDVDGQAGTEWLTTEAATTSSDPLSSSGVSAAKVIAARGDDGTTLWESNVGENGPPVAPFWRVEPHPYSLALRGEGGATRVLVGTYFSGTEAQPLKRAFSGQSELQAFEGASGTLRWDRAGDVFAPLALAPYEVDGTEAVLTTNGKLIVNVYSLSDGSVLRRVPLLADMTAVETADVNTDGVTDLIVGGQSNAVFALDGRTLGPEPSILWTTEVDGAVHEIHRVSLPSGEERVVVVVATASVVDGNSSYPIPTSSGIDVLAADTGARHFHIDTLPDYAWTAEVADLDGTPAIVVPTSSLTAYSVADGEELWRFAPEVQAPDPALRQFYFSNAAVTDDGNVAAQFFLNVGVNTSGQRIRPFAGNPNNHVRVLIDGGTGTPLWQVPITAPGKPDLWRAVTVGTPTAGGEPGVAFAHSPGQHPAFTTQVDVHDLNDGSLSYSGLMTRDSHRGTLALPVTGLVTFNVFNQIASISPEGTVERDLRWPAGHDLAQAKSERFGDVLVTSNEGHGWIGVFDARPEGPEFTRVADWVSGVTGGRLLVRDLDGDGSDEIVHYSFDNEAKMAVGNQIGTFDIGGDGGGGSSGIDIYRLDCSTGAGPGCSTASPTPTPTTSPTPSPTETPVPETTEVSFTEGSATSGQFSDETLFEARLTDSQGDPIENESLTFTLAGEGSTRDFDATTDGDGIASVTPSLEEKPGPHQLTVRYEGDEERAGSADTMAFTVEKEDTDTELTVEGRGGNMTLRAHLSDLDSPADGIAARTIDFFSDGEAIGSAQTGSDGVAEAPVPPGHRGANRTYEAVFAGDGFFLPSSGERPGQGSDQEEGGDAVQRSSHAYGGKLLLL